jgi:acetoin utilization protein AcuB
MLVKNWMTKDVKTVDVNTSMQQAITLMQEMKINLLPVMDGDKLIGVISDRDLKKASPSDATTLDIHEILYLISKLKIKDLMRKKPVTVSWDLTIEEAAAILLEKRLSSLPVLDDQKKLVGIITKNDIFKALIALTGFGKKGIQIAVSVLDMPGKIKEIRDIIAFFGARTASILSSGEDAEPGRIHIYFRIYDLGRTKMPELIKKVEEKADLLYVVDHKEGTRTIYT